MTQNIYIRQWVEVGGVLFPEIGVDLDQPEIEDELENLDLSISYFHAGWFDALFVEDLPEKLEIDFIFDYLCGWYAQKHELEIALKHCHWEEF